MSVKEYTTTATIAASPAVVWGVLTDAAGYADWNPEIVGIRGRFVAGSRIVARVRLGDGVVREVGQQVTALHEPSRMEWQGGLPLGLFVGRRIFTIEPGPVGTVFRMDLRMSGPLCSLILKSVGDRQADIDGFSTGLKRRAEAMAGGT